MPVSVIRTAWAGTSGGPGLTSMYIEEASGTFLTPTNAQSAVNAVRTFWDAIKSYLPDNITLTTSPVIDSYVTADGTLMGSTSAATPPVSVTGTSATSFAMAVGMKLNLNTGVIRDGRRVRGSVFIVPSSASTFTTDGVIVGTTRTAVNTAAATMLTSLSGLGLPLVVYSREREATETKPYLAGQASLVAAIETNEKGAILRGRRD